MNLRDLPTNGFEIQAWLYASLLDADVNVRGEPRPSGRIRPDLIVCDKNWEAILVVEVNPIGVPAEQIEKYQQCFGLPVLAATLYNAESALNAIMEFVESGDPRSIAAHQRPGVSSVGD